MVAEFAGTPDRLTQLRPLLADLNGREVTTTGDDLVAAFGSAVDAVRCGMAFQAAARSGGTVPLRIGLDAGHSTSPNDELSGTALAIARRLCALADAGGILISGTVHGLARRTAHIGMVPFGPLQVRGLPSPVDVWSVDWDDEDRIDPLRLATTVVVADDQRLIRTGFRVLLEAEPDITVVAEAADGLEAIDAVRRYAPDVVLMDIQMPRMDGLQAARQLLESSGSKVVVLTTFDADEYVYEALRIGASGFLLKEAPPDQLISAVRCAVRGDALIDPSLTRRLIDAFSGQRPAPPNPTPELDRLTSREREVLVLLARGFSNAEIAAELVVEETTVKTHVARILMKLGVRDRVQAVIRAYETRLVTPG